VHAVACLCCVLCCAGEVLRDMGLRDAFNVQLSVPALNGDAVATVLRALDCFSSGEVLQVRSCAVCPHPGTRLRANPKQAAGSDAECRLFSAYDRICLQAVDIMVTLTGSEEVPIKKLLLWVEMARQELEDPSQGKIPLQSWTKVLQNLGTGHGSSSRYM
jgi:hypothetical protein